jgi:predicted transcriptional regulator of viral defense system
MAAVLSTGLGSAASHRTAAALLGLTNRRPQEVEVVSARTVRRERSWVAHQSRDLSASRITTAGGIPVTTCARTIVDVAGTAPFLIERLADQAVRLRLMDYTELGRLVDSVRRHGCSGVVAVSELVASRMDWMGRTESELEDQFRSLLTEAGIEHPQT